MHCLPTLFLFQLVALISTGANSDSSFSSRESSPDRDVGFTPANGFDMNQLSNTEIGNGDTQQRPAITKEVKARRRTATPQVSISAEIYFIKLLRYSSILCIIFFSLVFLVKLLDHGLRWRIVFRLKIY